MALSVDWTTKVVSSTTSITDIVAFKEELRVLESSSPGILYDAVLKYAKLDLGGGAFFHAVDFINSYQLKFPIEGDYEIVGNINANIVPVDGVFVDRKTSSSFATIGSGGTGGGGLTPTQESQLQQIFDRVDIKVSDSIGNGGGGFVRNVGLDAQDKKYIEETHKKVLKLQNTNILNIEEKLSEIDSHIELAKEDVIDTIKEIENEVCSDIIRKTKEIKEDNIKTRNLVRQKTKNLAEIAQKQLDGEAKTQKMIDDELEEIEKLIEQNINFEADEIERQISNQIDKEIEEIESNQSNDGNNNGTEGEVQRTED